MVSLLPDMKHVACARCRDRKVKCDGGKPACKRCHRNGMPCRYVRGRKQRTGSEWLQHLRTFSSQPGRTDVTQSYRRLPSQPALPQTPRTQPHCLEDNFSSYARSPSPYLFEHVTIGTDGNRSATPSASSFSSQTSADQWSDSISCLPMSMEHGNVDPQSYLLDTSASFCATNFTSNLLATANAPAQIAIRPVSMMPYTPGSHASETASSYDGLPEVSMPYGAAFYCTPISSNAMMWSFTSTYEGQGNNDTSPSYSSPYP